MKRIIAAGLTVVILAVLASCGGSAVVSELEAREAFDVAYTSILVSSLEVLHGQDLEGVAFDEETDELTFDKFDLAAFLREYGDPGAGEGFPYTSVSGTWVASEDSMRLKLTLDGGPVKSIEFELTQAQTRSEDGFTATVKVNGKDMELEIRPDDFQG